MPACSQRGADGVHRLILSSATSSIIVFAAGTDAAPLRMISGVFFGGRIRPRWLGRAARQVADHTGIAFVYQVCAFLPAIGLLAIFLPKMRNTCG